MMDIQCLFVWTLGSVIRVIQLISTLKKLFFFVPSNNFDQAPIGSRVIAGFIQLLGSPGSLAFYLFLAPIGFAYTSRNPVTMGLRANTSDKNPKSNLIKHTSGLCEWLLRSVTQWIDQLDHQSSFVCISISSLLESTDQ